MAAIRRGRPQAKNQGAYREALVSAAADGCRPVVPARRKARVESRTRCNARPVSWAPREKTHDLSRHRQDGSYCSGALRVSHARASGVA